MTEEERVNLEFAAFDAGWRMAAGWADRDDLIHDMGSAAFQIEKAGKLRDLHDNEEGHRV
ncbi:MAG: hypothetical protein Unbinned5081contig1000_46 [Prokaryotic dsDNA virus sp.]|nr:MAG: hypothetical protein Unbinned5081contig1000_46 [Prokaryotic dsDNA virus sp.]|tara:strand:- start:17253 stop:17432 length:180 start_codon:yes stop_codon:yes gene_type:complete